MTSARVRFAPSPTGRLHIGSLRSALFNYLFAKHHKGTFILRIEDTDQKRTVPGALEDIVQTLSAYGLTPDEGAYDPNAAEKERGDFGPYTQSQRLTHYRDAAQQLLKQGSAYPCFCTSERLQQLRAAQENQHLPPGYDGLCRTLTNDDAGARIEHGEPHVIRFAMPKTGTTKVDDLIRGVVQFSHTTLEDTVLLKTDGYPTYHLANVVDDHHMQITHVIRAEEWLPSVPLHILLYQAFGWDIPKFAHIPLILGPSRKKLSKRDGALPAADYLHDYLPSALLNFLALLGWNPKTHQEYYPDMQQLIQDFDLAKVHKAGAIFDTEKLKHLNRLHMRALQPEALAKAAGLQLSSNDAQAYIPLAVDRAVTLPEVASAITFLTTETLHYDAMLLVPKASSKSEAKECLKKLYTYWNADTTNWEGVENLKNTTFSWIQDQRLTNLQVLWPARVALTGQKNSPDVFAVAFALGKQRTCKRLEQGIALLE